MAGWFDEHAKKSARATTAGISRRRIVVGGSAAVAAGWTAPMLMASSAAALGLSACPNGVICGSDPATQNCCPAGTDCSPFGGPACEDEVGGICANNGSGRCRVATVHCNGNANVPDDCNGCDRQPVCGGEGARCATAADCATINGFAQLCSNADAPDPLEFFCRRQCNGAAPCATGQFCTSAGLCAKECTQDNQCQSPGLCLKAPGATTGVCQYTQSTF